MARSNVYGLANLYHEFLDGSQVDLAGVNFANESDRAWGGIGAGGSYSWADDKYALYGELSLNTSLSNFADSYSVNGTTGFKVKFSIWPEASFGVSFTTSSQHNSPLREIWRRNPRNQRFLIGC